MFYYCTCHCVYLCIAVDAYNTQCNIALTCILQSRVGRMYFLREPPEGLMDHSFKVKYYGKRNSSLLIPPTLSLTVRFWVPWTNSISEWSWVLCVLCVNTFREHRSASWNWQLYRWNPHITWISSCNGCMSAMIFYDLTLFFSDIPSCVQQELCEIFPSTSFTSALSCCLSDASIFHTRPWRCHEGHIESVQEPKRCTYWFK